MDSEKGQGYIMLHRKIRESWVYSDKFAFFVWVDMLMTANYKDNKIMYDGQLITVKRGSFISSERKLAEKYKCSRSRIRRILNAFKKDGMLDTKSVENSATKRTTKGTVYSLRNYNDYQTFDKSKKTNKEATDCTTDYTTDVTQRNKDNTEIIKEKEVIESSTQETQTDDEGVMTIEELMLVDWSKDE
jgi:DNA replication protein DnaD